MTQPGRSRTPPGLARPFDQGGSGLRLAGGRAWLVLGPLCGAGFVTAFAAHAVAANLGGYAEQREATLVELGGLLALYDGAEVILKPVFGALADRVGPPLVLLGGLLGFAVASLTFVAAGNPGLLAAARFAQGMSAAAFSPAAGALVAIHGGSRRGGAFGSYGAAKSWGTFSVQSSAARSWPREDTWSSSPCSPGWRSWSPVLW